MTLNKKKNKSWFKWALILFKYVPILAALIMLAHAIFHFFGVFLPGTSIICGLSVLPFIVTYCLSKGLGFCVTHRLFILYSCLIHLSILWQHILEGDPIPFIVCCITVGLGVILFTYFFCNLDKYYYCRPVNVKPW